MRNPYDHEYPPTDWELEQLAERFETAGDPPLPARSDRDAWAAIAADDVTGALAARVIEAAEAAQDSELPQLTASLSRDSLTDDDARGQYLDRRRTFGRRLRTFTIAECLEANGRFIDDVLDYAWELCEWTTWNYPWTLRDRAGEGAVLDDLPRRNPPPEDTPIGLASSRIGNQLAETDHLLGEALHGALRERLRGAVDERVLTPYELRDDFWWLDPPTNNWNAVCNGQSLAAALYLEDDPDRLARLTKKATDSLYHFLAGFDADGGTAEGVAYWNYGVQHFVKIADHLEARTGGRFSLYDVPVVGELARFPVRTQLSPGRYAPFSDSDEAVELVPFLAARLGERFDVATLTALARDRLLGDELDPLVGSVRNLAWCAGLPDREPDPPAPRDYFRGLEWWIVRTDPTDPDGLVVAARGGDNAESHNHADCGSFVVHYRGESLLADLGSPTYPVGYFDEDRYTHLMARSLGHSVPLVNGVEQASGTRDQWTREHVEPTEYPGAEVIDRTEGDVDRFALDLTGAYPEAADLESLERRFAVDRAADTVTVTDDVTLGSPGEVESVLVSYLPMRVDGDDLVVTGERGEAQVSIAGSHAVDVEHLKDAVPVDYSTDPTTARDVWRARIGPVAGEQMTIDLDIDVVPTE